jgi:hypothetical protein
MLHSFHRLKLLFTPKEDVGGDKWEASTKVDGFVVKSGEA